MRQKFPNKKPIVLLFAAVLLMLSAVSANTVVAKDHNPWPTPTCDQQVVGAGYANSLGQSEDHCSTPTTSATPKPPSVPNTSICGQVSFTNVPEGWYLIVEPGDNLITSGFDKIVLAPGDYTYEFRDAGANDQVGGNFTVNACPSVTPSATPSATPSSTPSATPSATPTATPSATPTASRLPSPSAMPDTTTGSSGGDSGGAMAIVILGLALLFSGLAYILVRRAPIGPRRLS